MALPDSESPMVASGGFAAPLGGLSPLPNGIDRVAVRAALALVACGACAGTALIRPAQEWWAAGTAFWARS